MISLIVVWHLTENFLQISYMDLGPILNNCVFSWWWCELRLSGWMKFFDMILRAKQEEGWICLNVFYDQTLKILSQIKVQLVAGFSGCRSQHLRFGKKKPLFILLFASNLSLFLFFLMLIVWPNIKPTQKDQFFLSCIASRLLVNYLTVWAYSFICINMACKLDHSTAYLRRRKQKEYWKWSVEPLPSSFGLRLASFAHRISFFNNV